MNKVKNSPKKVSRDQQDVQLSVKKINEVRKELLSIVPVPKIQDNLHVKAKPSEKIYIPITGLPLPDMDLSAGKLEKRKRVERRNRRVLASFPGKDKPVICEGRYDEQRKAIELVVPNHARSGLVVLAFPVWASLAGMNQTALKKMMKIDMDNDRECIGMLPREEYLNWVPLRLFYYRFTCQRCLTDSICPNGAIQFDAEGNCYVDHSRCLGQSSEVQLRLVEGRSLFHRINEIICWECIGHLRCPTTISKVMDVYDCCGCCLEFKQVIEGLCLPDLCPEEAISGGNPTCSRCPPRDVATPRGYIVDQEACTGCMVCYDNITCHKVRMKARIHGPVEGRVIINAIQWREIRVPSSRISEMSRHWKMGVWGERSGEVFFEEIPIRFDSTAQKLIRRNYKVQGELHIALFSRKGKNGMIPLKDKGSFLRPAIITLSTKKGPAPITSVATIKTPDGLLEIEYRIG